MWWYNENWMDSCWWRTCHVLQPQVTWFSEPEKRVFKCRCKVYWLSVFKYTCQNIILKNCACISASLFVNAIYETITGKKRPLSVSYIMLHTYLHSSHNDAPSSSDNTNQNRGALLCLKQYLSLLHVSFITAQTVATEGPVHQPDGIGTIRGKRCWSDKIMTL